MSKTIVTIGFGKKNAERFIQLLKDVEVQVVIDTRRRPDSQLSGYARQKDLPFILSIGGAIEYEHRLELAPPSDLLDRYHRDKDWASYEADFGRCVLSSAEAKAAMTELLRRPETMALLCSEATPERCHRRLLVERMKEMDPEIEIHHLV